MSQARTRAVDNFQIGFSKREITIFQSSAVCVEIVGLSLLVVVPVLVTLSVTVYK